MTYSVLGGWGAWGDCYTDGNHNCKSDQDWDGFLMGYGGNGGSAGTQGKTSSITLSFTTPTNSAYGNKYLYINSNPSSGDGEAGYNGGGGGGGFVYRCYSASSIVINNHFVSAGAGGNGGCAGAGGKAGGTGGSAIGVVISNNKSHTAKIDLKQTLVTVTNGDGGLPTAGGNGGKGSNSGYGEYYTHNYQCQRSTGGGGGGGGGAGGTGAGGHAGAAYPYAITCTDSQDTISRADLTTLVKCGFEFPYDFIISNASSYGKQELKGKNGIVQPNGSAGGKGEGGQYDSSQGATRKGGNGGKAATISTVAPTDNDIDYSCRLDGTKNGPAVVVHTF